MQVRQQIRSPELLQLLADYAQAVHVRLALTPGSDDDTRWIARSLIVDAFPQVWLNHSGVLFNDDTPSRYEPRWFLHEYAGRALFLARFVQTDQVIDWLTHRDACELSGFDERPGQGSRVARFSIPEFQEQLTGARIYSGKPDGWATLPWPRNVYRLNLTRPNQQRSGDYETLYAIGQPHFDNLREARGKLIHDAGHGYGQGLQGYQDGDTITVRMIDADGWIHEARISDARVEVAVRGLRIFPGVVILKGSGIADMEQTVMGPRTVNFTLTAAPPPDLNIVLANEREELDRVWRTQWPSPFDPPAAHVRDEVDDTLAAADELAFTSDMQPVAEPEGAHEAQALTTQAEGRPSRARRARTPGAKKAAPADAKPVAKPAADVRLLRVVIASPGDVRRERGCVKRVLDELNRGLAGQLGLRFEQWMWETDAYPGFHADGPQGMIDASMGIETADIVVGIFWKRFGTSVGDAKSGTEHELGRARAAWKQSGHPHIMIYFNEKPPELKSTAEFDQYRAVHAFREEIAQVGLYWLYKGSSQFESLLRQHLELYLRKRYEGQAASAPTRATSPHKGSSQVPGRHSNHHAASADAPARAILTYLVLHHEPESAVTAASVSSATGLQGRELMDALHELGDGGAIAPRGNVANRYSSFTILIAAWERVDPALLGFDVREDMLRVAEVAGERDQIDRDELLAATGLTAQRLDIAALLLNFHGALRLHRPMVRGLTFRAALPDHRTRQYVREHSQ